MQTLWSRAVQSKCTCRCSSCIPYGTALARRSTTAAARRGLRFGDVFTAFYSSIFAIAAVADAKAKDARRQRWDEAIAEAKNDLEALERKQQSRNDASSADLDASEEAAPTEETAWQELLGRAVEEKKTRAALGVTGMKGFPLDLLENLSASEIEQLFPEVVCGDSETDLWRGWKSDRHLHNGLSTKRLKTFELSISKLILRFHLEAEERGNAILEESETSKAAVLKPSVSYRDELVKRIADIQIRLTALSHIHLWPDTSIDLESPNSPQYSRRFPNKRLNTALRTMFIEWEEQKADIGTLASRICYNLLVSSTPPDVHTYNMLIVVLCSLRQHGLVRAVLGSMRECHIPPNANTISAALKFYSDTNDRSGFEGFVKLVGGGRIRILDLNQPAISILSERSDVLPYYLFKRRRLVRPEDNTGHPVDDAVMLIIQKAPRDQAILEELFCSNLKFYGLSQARYCYKALVEEGWEVSVRMLTLMLERCAREENWRLGRLVWQQLHDLALQAGKQAYFWMLYLCHSCRRDREFQFVLKQAKSNGITPDMPIAWNLSSLERQVDVSCREIGVTAERVGDIELRIYRGPSVGHMINHKLKMLNIDSIATQTVPVRKDQDEFQKKGVETSLVPVAVGRSVVVQEAKDRRWEPSTPQFLPPPYETYPPLPRCTQDLRSVTELADIQFWKGNGEPAVVRA